VQAINGIGRVSAAALVAEIGDVSRFPTPAHLCSWVGLTPKHRESDLKTRRGRISKQGSRLVRATLIELAWSWLRFQPESALSKWFATRFAATGPRLRRVGIVAVARRLTIALWRYLKFGEIPPGAVLRAGTTV